MIATNFNSYIYNKHINDVLVLCGNLYYKIFKEQSK